LQAIRQVTFASSHEETRQYMNGILLHDDGKRLALVATDGYRLCVRLPRLRLEALPRSQICAVKARVNCSDS
jgi:DNA polymerase-3 subunit beta